MYVDKPPQKKKKAKQKENAEHQMAAKEQDYSRGNKKSEYLDKKNKPGLHEAKVHHCVSKAAPSVHICSCTLHPRPPQQTDNTTVSTALPRQGRQNRIGKNK